MLRFQGNEEGFPDVRIFRIDPDSFPQIFESFFGMVLIQQEQPVIIMDVQPLGIHPESRLESFPGCLGFLFFHQDPPVEGVIIRVPGIQLQSPLDVVQCPLQFPAVLEKKIRVPIMDEIVIGIHPESLLKRFVRLGLFLVDFQKNSVKGQIQSVVRLKTDRLDNGFQRPLRLSLQIFRPGHQIVGTGMIRLSGQNFGYPL